MEFEQSKLAGAQLITLKKIGDERGFFSRVWCETTYKDMGLNSSIAQINSSFNAEKGTLRGLHFQRAPKQEAKIVMCIKGSIFDVIVDMRPDSSTYLEWQGFHLNEAEMQVVYVPEGFAHGYQATSDNSAILYPSTEFYAPDHEGGLRWDDPKIGINWPLAPKNISEKDTNWAFI